jgi:drug/metabolite transporter (DMT)-like permease
MSEKFTSIIKFSTIFYCLIFTVATLANSIIALLLGNPAGRQTDHEHIIMRAGICLGVTLFVTIIVVIVENIKLKSEGEKAKPSKYLLICFTCVGVLILIITFIWARDLFISILIVMAIVFAVIGIIEFFKKIRKKEK